MFPCLPSHSFPVPSSNAADDLDFLTYEILDPSNKMPMWLCLFTEKTNTKMNLKKLMLQKF